MSKTKRIKFIGHAKLWTDADRNGGTAYCSVRVTRCSDGEVLTSPMESRMGDGYKAAALGMMSAAGWLPGYEQSYMIYERENDYPIEWIAEEVRSMKTCESHGEGRAI